VTLLCEEKRTFGVVCRNDREAGIAAVRVVTPEWRFRPKADLGAWRSERQVRAYSVEKLQFGAETTNFFAIQAVQLISARERPNSTFGACLAAPSSVVHDSV